MMSIVYQLTTITNRFKLSHMHMERKGLTAFFPVEVAIETQ